MKAAYLRKVNEAVQEHAYKALRHLYKAAGVGQQLLDLKKHKVTYSDGAEYTIFAIDYDPISDQFTFHQQEEDSDYQDTVTGVPIETLLEILEAVERVVNWHYDAEFKLPKVNR